MICNFHKYHGAGNDFIIIDNRNLSFNAAEDMISRLCHRRFGIGADGLLLLENSENYDFSMRYFNSDGKEGSMCGNGGRCISAWAFNYLNLKEKITFSAVDGNHQSEILKSDGGLTQVRLKMADVTKVHHGEGFYFLDTGSPHYVTFVDDADKTDVVTIGRAVRYSSLFPQGTNVNFVEIRDARLYVRTYERGVEDETLSCGTGVTASAIAASFMIPANSFEITTRGGNLKVNFSKENELFSNVWLEGPATLVFKGELEL